MKSPAPHIHLVRTRRVQLTVTRAELLALQDAIDDTVGEFDPGRAPSSLVALQRKLHALTGEGLFRPKRVSLKG